MSDQENFLTRWSRRKLEPADENAAAAPPATGDDAAKPETPAPQAEAAPEFDLSKLPSLDSIGATSDIRAFLQRGVPSALRNAALRRAWSADPAIRDFVGLNENFWDAAGVESAPGFGALDPSVDVKKLVREVFGDAEPEPHAPASELPAPPPEKSAIAASASAPLESQQWAPADEESLLQRDENGATHHDDLSQEAAATRPRRHGGAMPQ